MIYRFLGRTGVEVSALCLGTMTFGKEADEAESAALFAFSREAGINFFDCADLYAGGLSEEILGRLIRGCRDQVVITSKVFFPTGEDVNARGGSRLHVRAACEASLRRLGTDRIDIYFIHRFDGRTPLEETLEAFEDLVRQGKILYPAVSNFAAWQAQKALGLAALRGWSPIRAIQPMYNLIKRQAESEILPMAQAEALGVMPYSPLGGGLLSGKYGVGRKPGSGRLTEHKIYQARYREAWVYETADRFTEYARNMGVAPAALAVAWVAAHPAVTAPILGARSVEQLRTAVAALDIPMTPELRASISALSPEPAPATDRSEERTPDHFLVR